MNLTFARPPTPVEYSVGFLKNAGKLPSQNAVQVPLLNGKRWVEVAAAAFFCVLHLAFCSATVNISASGVAGTTRDTSACE
jgi:hypothetical protein